MPATLDNEPRQRPDMTVTELADNGAQSGDTRTGDILLAIRTRLPDLSKAHQQIAQMVLADPQWSVQSNVEDLAARAGVAKPTIVRFARAVGCEGLKDFKLKLAGSLALGSSYLHRSVRTGDTTEEVIANVIGSAMGALSGMAASCSRLLTWPRRRGSSTKRGASIAMARARHRTSWRRTCRRGCSASD